MYDWSGAVPAKLEQGQPTGLILKKGDVISIVAKGWVKYGHPDNYWAAPQGTLPRKPTLHDSLIAKIGDKTYGIGNGGFCRINREVASEIAWMNVYTIS
ncbi:LecA/PA-IL family lectin [Xenorhabdus bovienii]|uniref:LecA/PA-IL family lectin n=1 Tax=Xenorhabdus bovienii TaxID=40576 RepID=UPI003DA22658